MVILANMFTLNQPCLWPHPPVYNREGGLSKKVKYHPRTQSDKFRPLDVQQDNWPGHFGKAISVTEERREDSLLSRDQRDAINQCAT